MEAKIPVTKREKVKIKKTKKPLEILRGHRKFNESIIEVLEYNTELLEKLDLRVYKLGVSVTRAIAIACVVISVIILVISLK